MTVGHKGSSFWRKIDVEIDSSYLRLRNFFVFLISALILGLACAILFARPILVLDMCAVIKPGPACDRYRHGQDGEYSHLLNPLAHQLPAERPAPLSSTS